MVLGRLFKLHPDFDVVIVNLLRYFASEDKTHTMYLVLVKEDLLSINERIFQRLSSLIAEGEREEAMSRLRFVNYASHYHLILSKARVVLDTFPYGGCLTALDALYSNIPLLTVPSQFIR